MSSQLTRDDKAFIRALLDYPEELTNWLIYADWLDEQADPRGEFLRLSVERKQEHDGSDRILEIDERLDELRRTLDPNWVLVFDRALVANCREAGWRLVCPLRWDQLSPTDEPDIRICHTCKSPVFFCHSREEAEQFASSGQCVAFSSRIPLEDQPHPPELTMGLINLPTAQNDEMESAPANPPRRRAWWKFW